MREDLLLIALFLMILFYISKSTEKIILTEKEDIEIKDEVNEMMLFFKAQKYLGDVQTNVSDITTYMSVYEGETSCSFLYINGKYKCYVSGKNENQRLALLEILSKIIESDFSDDKMIWIKPNTSVKHLNGIDYFEA